MKRTALALTAAKFSQPMPGAAEALEACGFTDLDEDGSSNLAANLSFPDVAAASLLWLYADGGFVYNEERSILPGDAPAGVTECLLFVDGAFFPC